MNDITPKKYRQYQLRNGSMAKVLRIGSGWILAEVKLLDGSKHRERFTVADFTRQIAGYTTHAARREWKLAMIERAIGATI